MTINGLAAAKTTDSGDLSLHPDTIAIHIIWHGKLETFKVASTDNTKQQILYTVGKLNQILTEMSASVERSSTHSNHPKTSSRGEKS
jgi:hypothetical protein